MSKKLHNFLYTELQNLEAAGLYQTGLILNSPQDGKIQTSTKTFINFASDNYLGWANDKRLKDHVCEVVNNFGIGWASTRVVSGGHALHVTIEKALADFLSVQDTVLFASSYQAKMGLFENLFSEQDYIFCDFALQPSLVDGIRLSPAKQMIFRSHDLGDLEDKLKRSPNARFRAIVIDAVSPHEGTIAPLPAIIALAQRYDAIVVMDDSHGIGVLGKTGRGLCEYFGEQGKVDIVMGSFEHALGGADGGFISGRKDILAWVRQKARTYLFSNALSQSSLGAAQMALRLLREGAKELVDLTNKTEFFRSGLKKMNLEVIESPHPIVSVVVKDAVFAQKLVNRLAQRGVYVLGFCYPVVPRGSALLRAQVSAAHARKDLDDALAAFKDCLQLGKS